MAATVQPMLSDTAFPSLRSAGHPKPDIKIRGSFGSRFACIVATRVVSQRKTFFGVAPFHSAMGLSCACRINGIGLRPAWIRGSPRLATGLGPLPFRPALPGRKRGADRGAAPSKNVERDPQSPRKGGFAASGLRPAPGSICLHATLDPAYFFLG